MLFLLLLLVVTGTFGAGVATGIAFTVSCAIGLATTAIVLTVAVPLLIEAFKALRGRALEK